MKQETEL
jgi:MFS family permease